MSAADWILLSISSKVGGIRTPRGEDTTDAGRVDELDTAVSPLDGGVIVEDRTDALCTVAADEDLPSLGDEGAATAFGKTGATTDVENDEADAWTCALGEFRRRSTAWVIQVRDLALGAEVLRAGVNLLRGVSVVAASAR